MAWLTASLPIKVYMLSWEASSLATLSKTKIYFLSPAPVVTTSSLSPWSESQTHFWTLTLGSGLRRMATLTCSSLRYSPTLFIYYLGNIKLCSDLKSITSTTLLFIVLVNAQSLPMQASTITVLCRLSKGEINYPFSQGKYLTHQSPSWVCAFFRLPLSWARAFLYWPRPTPSRSAPFCGTAPTLCRRVHPAISWSSFVCQCTAAKPTFGSAHRQSTS